MTRRERSDAIAKTMVLFASLFPARTTQEVERAAKLAIYTLAPATHASFGAG